MREIKFRVWDIDGGKMSAGVNIDLFMQNECELEFLKEDESLPLKDFLFFRKEFSEWMQFTGLKDKNGKDIYEGDIVKHLTNNEKWEPLNDDSPIEIEVNSVVEWSGHGFWLSKEYFGYEGEGLANWEQLEIIGNIYENPELLKQ